MTQPLCDSRMRIPLPFILMSALFFCSQAYAESIDGFRDLKFGMTKEEVVALPACRSHVECLYELNEKNRYVELTYRPETASPGTDSTATDSTPRLAQITIDMGRYTDEWHQELQVTLGASYHLTQDLNEQTMHSFVTEQQDELNAGYEDGQVVLQVVRRPFGNITLKVVYQNDELAKEFLQQNHAGSSSPD